MTDAPPSVVRLARELVTRTRSKGLDWSISEFEEDEFFIQRRAGRVAIRSRDGDRRAPYVLEIYNKDGILAETFVTEDSTPPVGDFDKLVAELYEEARRGALDVDIITSELLKEIGDDG